MLFSFLRLKKIISQKSQKAEKIRVFFAFLFARDFSGMTRFFSSSSPDVQYERIMSSTEKHRQPTSIGKSEEGFHQQQDAFNRDNIRVSFSSRNSRTDIAQSDTSGQDQKQIHDPLQRKVSATNHEAFSGTSLLNLIAFGISTKVRQI